MGGRITFETHSISEDNECGIATGWLNGRLSERGRRLAKELGERRQNQQIDAIFTSDLGRAVETAEIAFAGSGIPIYQDERLRECNYGSLNGMPVAHLEGERPKHISAPYPNGESYEDVMRRVQDFLNNLLPSWDNKHIVIIGHSATRWALDCLLLDASLEDLVNAPYVWQEGWSYQYTSP